MTDNVALLEEMLETPSYHRLNAADEGAIRAAIALMRGQLEPVAEIRECAELVWLNGGVCQLAPGTKLYTSPAHTSNDPGVAWFDAAREGLSANTSEARDAMATKAHGYMQELEAAKTLLRQAVTEAGEHMSVRLFDDIDSYFAAMRQEAGSHE